MNTMVELKALLAGIEMVVTNGWFLVIIEGDSQLIVQMETKLLHGKWSIRWQKTSDWSTTWNNYTPY